MQLLRLRYYQIKRDLAYWFLVIVGLIFYISYQVGQDRPMYALGMCMMAFSGVTAYHHHRRDLLFIKHYLNAPRWQITLNYQLSILPLSLAQFGNGQWKAALLLHVLLFPVSFLQRKASPKQLAFLQRWIPAQQFEWIGGLRGHFYLVILLFLAALILSPVKLFGVFALFLLNSVFLSFYGYAEPRFMLNPNALSPVEFLNTKIRFLNSVLFTLNAPLLLINALCFPESAWFSVCFLAANYLLGASLIYIKYANYQPNNTPSFSLDQLFLFGAVIIPFLLPVSLYLFYSYRRKAILSLQQISL